MKLKPAAQDILAGLIFIAFAAAMLWLNQDHPIGTARRMGPGYMPMLTFWILGGLGLVIALGGLFGGPAAIGRFAWRDLALILAAMVFFGVALERLGFYAAIAGTIVIAAIAERNFRPLRVAGLVAGLLLLCWAIFLWGLELRIPEFPWSR